MNKFFNWLIGTFICISVICYCIIGEFVLLFIDEEKG